MFKEKLIRDYIVATATFTGNFRIADHSEILALLIEKLKEETNEVINEVENNNKDKLLNEIADVLEVLTAIASQYNLSLNDIEKAAAEKNKQSGSFNKFIVLTEPSKLTITNKQ
jgi:predicted house-cleaning noncanonical NTP pyrophosphatase (MazG superfamily)